MPRGDNLKGHRFKKGQSGNPKGRPKGSINVIPHELKELTVASFREVISKCVEADIPQLEALLKHPKTSALQVAIIRCFIKAANTGDYSVVERICERVVGKIPEIIHVKSENKNVNATLAAVAELPADTAKEKMQQIIDGLKEEY